MPDQLQGEEPRGDVIIENNEFIVNNELVVQATQMIELMIEESIDKPFEHFRGRFVLNWSEFKDGEIQFIEPHNLKFTIRFPKQDDWDTREYNLRVTKSIRNNYPRGNYYPELGEYSNQTSHSEFVWWGVPDYQYRLMFSPIKQHSFRKKKFHEIFKTIQEDCLEVEYNMEDDEYIEECLNQVPQNDSLVFPQTVPTLSVIEKLVIQTWYPNDIETHTIPVYFINDGKFYYKIQYKENSKLTDIYVGDYYTKKDTEHTVHDELDQMEELKYIFDTFELLPSSRVALFGTIPMRNSKHIHEQDDEQKIPLHHKQTLWMNSQQLEPLFEEAHENYKEYWEFDQYYLDDEYFLENRMGKKYNLQLLYAYYGSDKLRIIQSSQRELDYLENMKLTTMVKIHFKDSQLINKSEEQMDEKIIQSVFKRNYLIYPQIQSFNLNIEFAMTGKWNKYKEDESIGFWSYIEKQDKDSKTYIDDDE